MRAPAPPPRPHSRRGVALGVMGLMLLAFTSLVFMLGRPNNWHFYPEADHPATHTTQVIGLRGGVVDVSKLAVNDGVAIGTQQPGKLQTQKPIEQKPKAEEKKPEEKKPEEKKPEEKKPEEKKPEEKKPEEKKPEEKKPEEKKPEEKKPEEKKPEEKKPEEKKPEEKKAEEKKPEEKKPEEKKPEEKKSEEKRPEEKKPEEKKPEEKKQEEKKPEEQKPEEKKPEEKKPEEKKQEEKKAEEKKPEEKKPEEKKVEEKQQEEKKPEEKKAEEKKAEEPKVETKPEEKKVAEQKPVDQKGEKSSDGETELDKKYAPTRERVQALAQDGYVVVTWANYHYLDFVKTWVMHVKKVGITGYMVGAMDDQLLKELIDHNVNTFHMKSGLTLGDFGWGSKTFAKMGREKIRLCALFLGLGVQVVIADVDVMFLRNPLPYFQRYPDADILTSSDHLRNTVTDESLEKWPEAASAANIGIMLFRNKSLTFVKEWIEIIERDDTIWDQNAFNDLFRRGVRNLPDDPNHLFLADNGKLKMGILPVSIFCSGHTYFTQNMPERLNLSVYAVHATFQFSGTPGKRHRYRERMLWEDPASYYDHSKGFVSFKMEIPKNLIDNGGPRTRSMDLGNVGGHFDLVNYQLIRIRNAYAIASILGRAIVMPQLWCGMDRWWAPHSGVIPGSDFPVPFKCPMDHVFDLEGGWHRQLPENDFGPNVPYKEYSFFDNPRMTPAVKDNKVIVEVCPADTNGCSNGDSPAEVKDGKVRMQENLLSDKIKNALANTQNYKVLEFTTMTNAFKNFTSPDEWNKFYNRMKIFTSIWCCVHAHPGHIHYDMLWDVPHKDKFDRQWQQWEPKCGP